MAVVSLYDQNATGTGEAHQKGIRSLSTDGNEDTDAPTGDSGGASAEPREAVEHREPSLGPACLVVVVLGLASFAAICAFASFFTFRDQYPLAEAAIADQLIPWIESSQLAPEDRVAIIGQLQRLRPMLRYREIDNQQLSRLRSCLQDNPVLLWGAVQRVEQQAAEAGLSELELSSLRRLNQRLLHGAAERKLGRNDLEYVLQPCAKVREDGQSLETVEGLTAAQIRQYMERAEQVLKRNGIPNEPFDKTPAEAFAILIDAALNG